MIIFPRREEEEKKMFAKASACLLKCLCLEKELGFEQ